MNETTAVRLAEGRKPFRFLSCSQYFSMRDTPVTLYEDYKISILLTDGLAAVLNGRVYNAVRGDILLFRPDEIHFGRVLRAGLHRYVDFYLPVDLFSLFSPDCSSLLDALADTSAERVNHLTPDENERRALLAETEDLIRISESDDPAKEILLFEGLLRFLIRCRTLYAGQKKAGVPDHTPAVLTRALRFINAGYTEPIDLAAVAAESGCSVTYLTKTFRQYLGKSVWGYLTECRLNRAAGLLRAGSSVTEACYASGFGDCSNFIRVFRKRFGMTPLRYAHAEQPPEMK